MHLYWLYKNINTGALLWSKKSSFSPNPLNPNKWIGIGELIEEFSTHTKKIILFSDCVDYLD